jgi:hypothetical protein
MRTVVIQGGWRMWLLLVLGGTLVLALGLVAGVILLGLLAVGLVVLAGFRVLQALGVVSRRPVGDGVRRSSTDSAGGIVDADFQVVGQRSFSDRPDFQGRSARTE